MRRVVLVVTERRAGLTPARVERYERVRSRLAEVADAAVETIHHADAARLEAEAVVLSGSYDPWHLHDPVTLARLGEKLLAYEGPVLGICAGMQLQARFLGGTVGPAARPDGPGFTLVEAVEGDGPLAGLAPRFAVYEEHSDEVTALPETLRVLARSAHCAVEAIAAAERPWWGTQFHPEEWTDAHPAGREVLAGFFALAGIPVRQGQATPSRSSA